MSERYTEISELKKPGTDQTILYIVANEELGWRKIGVGFGGRLDKWRREGWVIEQMATFDTREEALFAEAQVKKVLSIMSFDESDEKVLGRMLPREGATEVWPIEWGTFDLREYKALVDQFSVDVNSMFQQLFLTNGLLHIIDGVKDRLSRGENVDENLKILGSLEMGVDEMRRISHERLEALRAEKTRSSDSCEEF